MKKIAVLGLGPSINLFIPEDYEMSIGVNDIWKFHKSEVIVCLDKRTAFTAERYDTIRYSRPQAFYSQVVNWDFMPGFQKIEIAHHYPDRICNLDIPEFNKSYCSPFIACQIAFRYYGATEIHLFGVDLVNHPHLNFTLCGKIKTHFKNLAASLNENGCKLIVYGSGILKDIFVY